MAETFEQQLKRLRQVARRAGTGNIDRFDHCLSSELEDAVAALLERYDALLSQFCADCGHHKRLVTYNGVNLCDACALIRKMDCAASDAYVESMRYDAD